MNNPGSAVPLRAGAEVKRTRYRPSNPTSRNNNAPAWRKVGNGWLLLAGRRRFGRVVPDPVHHGLYRSVLPRGRWSDTANLSWAKNAVLVAAERELEFEARQQCAIRPRKCPEKGGVFSDASSLVHSPDTTGARHPSRAAS